MPWRHLQAANARQPEVIASAGLISGAQRRYTAWREDAHDVAVPALRRVLTQMTDDRFTALSQFLRQPRWDFACCFLPERL